LFDYTKEFAEINLYGYKTYVPFLYTTFDGEGTAFSSTDA
jgi:hypothetical protein